MTNFNIFRLFSFHFHENYVCLILVLMRFPLLLHLSFHFEPTDENHLDFILGFYDHALQDFSDDLIVEGQRVIFHAIKDGKNLLRP